MRTKSLVLCSLILGVAPVLLSAAPQSDPLEPDLGSLITSAKKIHRRLIERSQDRKTCDGLSLNCLGNGVEDLKQLLKNYTESALNSKNGDLKSLIAALRQVDDTAFAETMKKEGFTLKQNWDTDPPFVIRRQLPLGEIVITLNHFSLGALALPSDVVIIQAFRKEGAGYVFADQTGDELFGILRYSKFETLMPAQSVSQLWLLVQGQVSGYMGDLERARLYSFDGYKFSREWRPEDRLDMTIKVTGVGIDARYLSKTIHQVGADTVNCMEEKMQVEPGALLRLGILNHGECEEVESVRE